MSASPEAGTLRSMTGFGRAMSPLAGAELAVEVRSTNSRHLDVRVRLPREWTALEPDAREAAAPFFARGQVEVSVRAARDGAPLAQVEIDAAQADRYADAARALSERHGIEPGLSAAGLLALPGVARLREPELAEEALRGALRAGVERACAEAAAMRAREGQALARELGQRLGEVEGWVSELAGLADQHAGGIRERLRKRLAQLAPELEVDPGRLEQEVVLLVDRSDVTEELVRLRSHATQFRETLERGGPAGRKLDFLLQEMAREANTIGSKAQDAEIARRVVELKTQLEKLREQVQNVE